MTLSTTSHASDAATGLITGVQPVHFLPNAEVAIGDRTARGDLANLPSEPRKDLGHGAVVAFTDSVRDALAPWAPWRSNQQ